MRDGDGRREKLDKNTGFRRLSRGRIFERNA
jgi:hypothetical protein